MTDELYYTAQDIAIFISLLGLSCREESQLIATIWDGEQELLNPSLRKSKRQYILDVNYWLHYFIAKDEIDSEFPCIQQELSASGHDLDSERFTSDLWGFWLYFKFVRLRILYGGEPYVRVKIRTLLAKYGYKRRSQQIVSGFEQCIDFYQLEASLRGGTPCVISDESLDSMIVFRVRQ